MLDDMAGLELGSSRWNASRSVAFRFGIESVHGSERRVGTTCSGLIVAPDPSCVNQELRDVASMFGVHAGVIRRLLTGSRGALDIGGLVQLGGMTARTRGATTGRVIRACDATLGVGIEILGQWVIGTRARIAIEGSLGLRRFATLKPESVDGYSPFQDGFGSRRIQLGLVLGAN